MLRRRQLKAQLASVMVHYLNTVHPPSLTSRLTAELICYIFIYTYILLTLQTAAARVVSNTGKFDQGLTHLLHSELHWLDVPERILHKLGVTVHRCLQGKAPQYLVNCCESAATPHRTLPVVSDFDLPAATILSYHDIVAARSAVGRSPSPVRWPGMRCLAISETRRSVPTISGRS